MSLFQLPDHRMNSDGQAGAVHLFNELMETVPERSSASFELSTQTARFYASEDAADIRRFVDSVIRPYARGIETSEPYLTLARDAFVEIRLLVCADDVREAELECVRRMTSLDLKYDDLCGLQKEHCVYQWRERRLRISAARVLAQHELSMLKYQRGYLADVSRHIRRDDWNDVFEGQMEEWMYDNSFHDEWDAEKGGYDEWVASSDDVRFPVDAEEDARDRTLQHEYKQRYKGRKADTGRRADLGIESRAAKTHANKWVLHRPHS